MKLLARLEKRCEVWMLISILFGFFLLRLPSLYEPYWYGDEGIYQAMGKAMLAGKPLYSGVWDNKPPLLYTLYAVLQADQFIVRVASLLFGIGAIVAFFYLARNVFKQHTVWAITTSIFALFLGTPFIEGNIANAENFMVLPIVMSALLIYHEHHTRNQLALAGFLLGIAFLFKIVAIFDFAAMATFLGFLIYTHPHGARERKEKMRSLLFYLGGFIAPLVFTCVVFLFTNQLPAFLEAMLFSNVGYVGWKNDFIIPQGFLIFKILLLSGALGALFYYRKHLTLAERFITIWVLFSVFNAFFSQRPYIHYQLVLVASMSLLVGLLLQKQSHAKKIFFVVFTIAVMTLVHKNFDRWTVKRSIAYYDNFIRFMSHAKSVTAYQSFFDSNVPRDYQLASYIRMHAKKEDGIYIWGNSAQIYVLAGKIPPGRYTVAYHVNNPKAIKETQAALNTIKPKYIIIMPDIAYYPFDLHNYEYKVTIDTTHIYEKIL